ncbi:MAG: universal stress protein [Pyrinomonadaceae bacterium]|nr:universal stress protein [Pyrinomonadaceae bacterium]
MKILIATDGSEFSQKAVVKCCEFVPFGKAPEIKVISVVEGIPPIAAEPFALTSEYYVRLETDLKTFSEKAIKEAEKIIKEKFGDNAVFETELLTGRVKEVIIEEAKKFGADLIVVGSHGYGFLDRVLLGSISDFVVHHAPCSVLVVREDKKS